MWKPHEWGAKIPGLHVRKSLLVPETEIFTFLIIDTTTDLDTKGRNNALPPVELASLSSADVKNLFYAFEGRFWTFRVTELVIQSNL